jgi:UDP-glucose 4-epimerase
VAPAPITITSSAMTRFLLSLEEAVDAVFAAVCHAARGETVRAPRAFRLDQGHRDVLRRGRPIPIVVTGIRPGEKTHEILVSEEEGHRTVERGERRLEPMLLLVLRTGHEGR